MQTPFDNAKEQLSKTFRNLSQTEAQVSDLEFEDCRFEDCNFTETTFSKCRFIECTFVRCNFSLVKVPQCQFTDVVFEGCKLVGVDWTRAAWPRLALPVSIRFSSCIINDSSFFGLKLDELVIEKCKAQDVDFRDGSFCRAMFCHTDFSFSLFGKTNVAGADFSEATNYDIDVLNNNVEGAKFSRFEAVRLLSGLKIELVD